MAYKAYFGKEASEFQELNPKGFKKSFDSYKKTLRSRIKTFERHGRGESSSAKRLKEALYDAVHARSKKDKSSAFSRMSFVLTSARGSYTKSREIDRKIVQSLNEEFSKRDPETGEIIEKFIDIKDLDEFGKAMDEAKNASWSDLYGSEQIAKGTRSILQENKGKRPANWRSLLQDWLENNAKVGE